MINNEHVGVVGLGYTGLSLSVSLSNHYVVTGFDNNAQRIVALNRDDDCNNMVSPKLLSECKATWTCDASALSQCTVIFITVPTPIDETQRPDLSCFEQSSKLVGKQLTKETIVVYETTGYPTMIEEVGIPLLESVSGKKEGKDFFVAYCPERMNPGDPLHTLEQVVKVVATPHEPTKNRISQIYKTIMSEPICFTDSIVVAEAAKVLENTQRDVNIALINECAQLFDRLGISTDDVLKVADTKWNFYSVSPGFVGGHCIPVDPYYLIDKAHKVELPLILAEQSRLINDRMVRYVAQKIIDLIDQSPQFSTVGIMGITFKENVSDIRNSPALELIELLKQQRLSIKIHDPYVSHSTAALQGVTLCSWSEFNDIDVIIVVQAHEVYQNKSTQDIVNCLSKQGGVLFDMKSIYQSDAVQLPHQYCSL